MNATLEQREACARIVAWFAHRDAILRATIGTSVHDTTHGIWGSTDIDDAFALCERLDLRSDMRFVDLGSGDGRIALIAALFCDSVGIEGDAALHHIATQARNELITTTPQLARCTLVHADYTSVNLTEFDIMFSFADHAWPATLEYALASREKPGMIIAHQDIFRPSILRKGPTIWIKQTPFVTYPIGK